MLRQFNLPVDFPPLYPYDDEDQELTELEPTYRFSDPINRVAWHNMAYSPDGIWLAGGSSDSATHKIYIWDLSSDGQFVTSLDGGREPLLDVTVISFFYENRLGSIFKNIIWYLSSGILKLPLLHRLLNPEIYYSGIVLRPKDGERLQVVLKR